MQKISLRRKFTLVCLSALAYVLMDIPVQMTGVLPSYAGIKNFLPFTLGLFFGLYGATGCIAGCVLSSFAMNLPVSAVMYECFCIAVTGLGMFFAWHIADRSGRIRFKSLRDYGRYTVLLAVLSALCGNVSVSCAYFLTGLFIGVPVNILFSSLLYVEPVVPGWCRYEYDAVLTLEAGTESFEDANQMIAFSAIDLEIKPKRIYEIQSCIEELSIRIFKAIPDAKINISLQFGDAISSRLKYDGRKYNPLRVEKDEDEIDIMSLQIIKHRALRASFSFHEGTNEIHVVV